MYVVMGHTRGDDLIGSTAKALFAHNSYDECKEKMTEIQQERDDWLAANSAQITYYNAGSVYARYSIVETPF